MRGRAAAVAGIAVAAWAATSGCQGGWPGSPQNSALEGVWALTRGDITVTFTWTVNNGGEVIEDYTSSQLEPLNPADFPSLLQPLVDQWNAGLADLNAKLDEAMPDEVLITFPGPLQMTLTDPDDATRTVTGLLSDDDHYIFVGDLSGAGEGSDQGGGALLDVATIDGSIDRSARTTTGKVARTLAVLLIGGNSGLVLTAQVSVAYTGERTGDLPEDTGDTASAP